MSWMNVLYETYDKIEADEEKRESLEPIGHMFANAQLEVELAEDGEFEGASIIDKNDKIAARTLVPVTESSGGRASGIAPHPLCDQLQYVAGDFEDYCEKEKDKKTSRKKFEAYIEALGKWAGSENSHNKVKTIYKYLSKRELISDLVKSGKVKLDENGIFDKSKISGQNYERVFVRFRVYGLEGKTGTWEDESLIKAYEDYYFSNMPGDKYLCYIMGEEKTITENHPKGIVSANYGAKLVSANDTRGYTFRGRFQNSIQACTVSYEASQKVHSALTWLAANQEARTLVGTKEKRTFIVFNPDGKKVPDAFDSLLDLDDEDIPDTDNQYRKKLRDALSGYKNNFDESDSVVVMSLDAATTGRLSVTYYNQLMASEFLKRIEYWYEACSWQYPYTGIKTPTFRQIAAYAFGTERKSSDGKGGFIELNDKLLKQLVQRLLKCMVEKGRFPSDIMRGLVMKASNPVAYSSDSNREKVLSTACAVIRKYHYDRGTIGEAEKNMSLDYENRDRSYLFGRLLAVYERAEASTYESGEKRTTNAMRMQTAFVNHPYHTWLTLESKLNPYFNKLDKKHFSAGYYKKIIDEIVSKLSENSPEVLNKALNENYLMGYYLQRAEFFKKKESDENLKEDK